MTHAVVTGASGLLGGAVARELHGHFDHVEGWSLNVRRSPDGLEFRCLDLRASGLPESALEAGRPDLVIHCAALTDVDGCEHDASAAQGLNVEVPRRLAMQCRQLGIRLIHISTDAVYDGESPGSRSEDDPPAPVNAYATSKLAGERGVLESNPDALVLRTTMHGWTAQGRRSFSEALLAGLVRGNELKLFSDVTFSALNVAHSAELIRGLAATSATGVLNLGTTDAVDKETFGRMLAAEFDLDGASIVSINVADLQLAAPRPRRLALDVSRLTAVLRRAPPSVADGLRRLRQDLECGEAGRLKGRDTNAIAQLFHEEARCRR
jgi:dTDP-4-dehydrorhamnose reductase